MCDVIRLTALAARSHSALAAENLFLRKHIIVLDERHLRRLIRDYVNYHHDDRIHDSLPCDFIPGLMMDG